jgi:general secretion pathway protein I
MKQPARKVQLFVRKTAGRRQKGFSLLEVLVAFSILALSMGVLMQIFSSGLHNVERSGHHVKAVAIAKSLLARLGRETPVLAGEQSGEFGDPERPAEQYNWQMTQQALEDVPESGPSGQPVMLSPFGLMGVTIRVDWPDGHAGRRAITLFSTKLYTKTP